MKPKIYTIATAHLDTSWLWKLETTISDYLPDTIKRNFEFFEKYPEYKFNFEGSLRYEFIKEYYPEDYKKLKEYVKKGNWNPCGACFENGDVNIPSPEALIRNILYGKSFFKNELGYESDDIFLPDCFGFGKALPTVASHSGVKGFSTGKLFWGSSVGIPFDTGKWKGIDGSFIWAALMPFSYTTSFRNMNKADRILEKIESCKKKGLPQLTFAYHGNGDRGGAPYKKSVKAVINAQRNNSTSNNEVYSSTPKEYFDIIDSLPDSTKSIMPEYDGEFLLTEHGVGSYTSRTVTKRWNRRCELLADAAERFSTAAFIHGYADYPSYQLDNTWKKVLAHHFHDDITGTSFEECYIRSHNDYVQAMNTFSQEYKAACKAISDNLDTSFCLGTPIVVSNPVQSSGNRSCAAAVTFKSDCKDFSVFTEDGKEVPSQVKFSNGSVTVKFASDVPSCGLSVYDLRPCAARCNSDTGLYVSENHIENNFISVKIDSNGDICSIFDKTLNKELISAPIRQSLQNNVNSFNWPAWEIKYADISSAPYAYPHSPVIKIADNGPVFCSLEITRHAGSSEFRQIISLDYNSRYVTIYNETDWREEASLLKTEFRLSTNNDEANYDIGLGYVKRGINTEKLYEVPAQKWADITNKTKDFGVSVFSDSRSGWDHPDASTLRLTLMHTPLANYRWECSQHVMDMGLNRYSYAIMGHKGEPAKISHFADCFCQPVHTFITEKHSGTIASDFCLATISDDRIRITALKKALESDRIIFRVAECSGNDIDSVDVRFTAPIKKAYEISGDENIINSYDVTDGNLSFSIKKNSLKSFALEFEKHDTSDKTQTSIDLPFNATAITSDAKRNLSTLKNGFSAPAELIPENLLYSGINYSFSNQNNNCIVCQGQAIELNDSYSSLHLLLTSINGDKAVDFTVNDTTVPINVCDCFEPIGHWDLMRLHKTGYIKNCENALILSHTHDHKMNLIAKQFNIFHAEIKLNGCNRIQLPQDDDIIIFAATAEKKSTDFTSGDPHYDCLEKRRFNYSFSAYSEKLMNPNKLERALDKIIDSSTSMNMMIGEFYNKYTLNELYNIFRTINNKLHYKKNVKRVTSTRNN